MHTRFHVVSMLALVVAAPALAETKRDLSAHEHGSGALNIAVEGGTIAIELEVPGADIVGFEYAAESAEDRAKVDDAIADLAKPLELFVVPAGAGCTVTAANVELIGDDHDHDHDEDHAEAHDDDHGHDEEHAEAHGDDHDHGDEHADEAGADHTEFHAEYTLACSDPTKIDLIEFAYFDRFANALELDVQVISSTGAQGFEVERDDPVLDMRGMF